jgi:ABC-type oligopeptide transport system ATPase subunit
MEKLFELRNLKKYYPILGGILRRPVNSVKAVDDIDLDIYRGECLGLVGESGCEWKYVLSLSSQWFSRAG